MIDHRKRRSWNVGRKRYALLRPACRQAGMRCAQSVLESTVAYAAVMAVLGAAMGIFGWGIAHIPARQATYEATRIMAGSPSGRNVDENGAQETTTQAVWPTYLAGGGAASVSQ